MNTCKTCRHWLAPTEEDYLAVHICAPADPDTFEPMQRGFETRQCKHPSQAFHEAPVQPNSFALTDASDYFACLATGEDFGCILHDPV